MESVCWGAGVRKRAMNFYEASVGNIELYAHVCPGVRHSDPGLHVRGKRPCIRQADWGSGYLLFASDSSIGTRL
jgi:hypothetical protein